MRITLSKILRLYYIFLLFLLFTYFITFAFVEHKIR